MPVGWEVNAWLHVLARSTHARQQTLLCPAKQDKTHKGARGSWLPAVTEDEHAVVQCNAEVVILIFIPLTYVATAI